MYVGTHHLANNLEGQLLIRRTRDGKGANTDAPCEVVNKIADLKQVAAEHVHGVHHDGVPGTHAAEQRSQLWPVTGGLLVAVDTPGRDACAGKSVELTIEALFVVDT